MLQTRADACSFPVCTMYDVRSGGDVKARRVVDGKTEAKGRGGEGWIRREMVRRLVVLVLLMLGMVSGELRAEGNTDGDACLSLRGFLDAIPGAGEKSNQDGSCYLVRWDGCRIIAVVCTYEKAHVPLIFVNADTKEGAVKVARQLVAKIPCSSSIRPFEKREPWVAILCPCLSESQRYTPNVLLYPNGGKNTRFIGWQGKLLRAQIECESTDNRGRKRDAFVEIVLDITEARCSRGEFRAVKGRLEDDEIKEIVSSRMSNVSSYMPDLSGRERRALKEKFPGSEVLAYSTVTNTCIVRKGKTFHAGAIDLVSDYISTARSVAEFEYPDEEIKNGASETEGMSPKGEKALVEERPSPEGEVKPEGTQKGEGEVPVADKSASGRAGENDVGNEAVETPETPPKTVQEAISNYIRFLNGM